MIGRLRAALLGSGRWVAPSRRATWVLGVVVATAALGAAASWAWGTRRASPARTLATASSVVPGPMALTGPLDVAWRWSLSGTDALAERWLDLVAPTLPPGLCPGGAPGSAGAAGGDPLALALRRLDAAVRRGAARDELERRTREVRDAADGAPGTRAAFLARYGLARGYAAGGDWAAAADVLEPVFDGWLAERRVPDTNARIAAGQVDAGLIDRTTAVDAVHGRHLAGTIAFHRGEAATAVERFRTAINAVHFVIALDGGGALATAGGHERRVPVDPGASACPGGDPPLTSLDAYAGLVAAYMADEDFRDTGRLMAEVRRSPLEIDPDDPFGPVLAHARRTGGDPARTPIPENLVWAASNLQRVYHRNRLRPDPRLEVTRAVLLLRLTSTPRWARTLEAEGSVCGMLGGIAGDLREDASALSLGRADPGPADSARAAVAVQTFARLESECADAGPPRVEDRVKSGWLRLAGPHVARGLGSRFEGIRTELAAAVGASGASRAATEERVSGPLARARALARTLERGRVPPDLPADLDVAAASGLASAWWDALFVDVARELLAGARDPARAGQVRAGDVEDYLDALFSATSLGDRRPGELWSMRELDGLAATGGPVRRWAYRLRWILGTWPGLTALALAAIVGGIAVLAGLVHVSVWRYRMTVRERFWRRERRGRGGLAEARP